MSQQQGDSSTAGGRIDGSIGTAVAAVDFALGVGWGTTAAVAVAAGSNDQRGIVTVTSNGTGQAQATADITLTFKDGSYAAIPGAVIWTLLSSSNAVNEAQPTQGAVTATQAKCRHSVLPVAAATYKFAYLVVA